MRLFIVSSICGALVGLIALNGEEFFPTSPSWNTTSGADVSALSFAPQVARTDRTTVAPARSEPSLKSAEIRREPEPPANRLAAFARTSPLFTPGTVLPSNPGITSERKDAIETAELRRAPVVVRVVEPSTFISGGTAYQPAGRAEPVPQPASRYDLIVSLQQELRRAACYDGAIDGDWGAGSRRAMSDFLTHVNASLPVYDPDYVQLVLLRTNPGAVCAISCGAGETRSASGRCVARSVIASAITETNTVAPTSSPAAPEQHAIISGWTVRVDAVAKPEPLVVPAPRLAIRADQMEGRMALSGPRPEDVPAVERLPSVVTQPDPRVAATPVSTLPEPTAPTVRKTRPAPVREAYVRRTKTQRQRALFREAFGDSF